MKRKPTSPRFSGLTTGMGGHHSTKAATVEWATPEEIVYELGDFDLDPCAPIEYPVDFAREKMTILDDGLLLPWRFADGRKKRVFLNPPYENGEIDKWLEKMAMHDYGTALIFARTETDAFFRHVWERAAGLLFIRGRLTFRIIEPFSIIKGKQTFSAGDAAKGNAGAPTVLCAYGERDLDILAACKIDGQFVALRFPRSVFVEWATDNKPWRVLLEEFFADRQGPVHLDELYRHFRGTAKAAGNPNFDAKIRQQLQAGPYERVAPGAWVPK